jgi:hypothetical protein
MSFVLPSSAASMSVPGYASLFAIILILLFVLFLIPSLLPTGVRPEATVKALLCVVMQGVGVGLMSISGLPALIAVFSGIVLPHQSYLALLLIFAIGGLLFLWYESKLVSLDATSKALPVLLFFVTLKFVGMSTLFLSALILVTTLLTTPAPSIALWVSQIVFILYGLFLLWSVREFPAHKSPFQSTPMAQKHLPVSMHVKPMQKFPVKPALKKKK